MLRVALAVCLLVACGPDAIEVRPVQPSPLVAPIDGFVAAGRTPGAFRALAHALAGRGDEAEVRLLVLALAPVQTASREALALDVWPALLGVDGPADGEGAMHYVQRLCAGPLRDACVHAAPEAQPAVVRGVALHRATVRVRAAVERCLACASDPSWHEAALVWEELDRSAQRD